MKKFYQTTALAAGMLCMFGGTSAFAGSTSDMETIKHQVQELLSQNQQLTRRIAEMEEGMKTQGAKLAEVNKKVPLQAELDEGQDTSNMISKYVSFGGAIEVEGGWSEGFDGASSSSIDLATAEFAFEAQVSDWATGVMAIEWDGDEDKINIDEAFIFIGNTDEVPVFLQAGRYIVPFGIYEGNTISDPLTKEAFETKEDAVLVGFESSGFYANAYAFNGETNEGGGDDTIEHFGGNVGYRLHNDDMAFGASVDLISSVFDADGLTDGFPDSMESDYASGLAAHAIFGMAGFGVIAEYITALDEVDGVEPKAWQIEGFYETEIGGRGVIFGLSYSETDDLGGVLPESRIAAVVGVGLLEEVGLTFEYTHDEDYDVSDGGTGESADAFTAQLAYEF